MTGVSLATETSPALTAFVDRSLSPHGVRNAALAKTGIPNRRVEAWRYTPLRRMMEVDWQDAPVLDIPNVEKLLARFSLPRKGHRVVFANGREISELSALPKTVMRSEPGMPDPLEDRFSAVLNNALAQEGLSIRVPAGVDAGLLTLCSLHQGGRFSTHLRHRIVLEEGASLTLFDLCGGEGGYLANSRLDIVLAERAKLTHVKHQTESPDATHLGIVTVHVGKHAEYDGFTLNRGSVLARHEVVARLDAPHALVHVNGVQLVGGARLNDLTSMIHHAAADCNSRQTVKTVLSENAQGVFQGKILVDRVAQKTDGYQMNQALLLSEKAQINSKPELEIYADDVKCSHGATVGALDEEQLFYLRSRGVPEKQARDMLVHAFLTDALDLVSDESLRALLLESLDS